MILFLLKFIIFITPLYLVRFKIFGIPTTPLEISLYILFLVWLVGYSKNWTKNFNWKLWLPIGLIFFGATLSMIFSKNIIVSGGIWKAYFLDPLLFLVVLVTATDLYRFRTDLYGYVNSILSYFLLSGYIVTIVSLVYLLAGNLTYDGRLSAFYPSPNHLAMFLAPAFLVNIYFLFSKSTYLGKYFSKYFFNKIILVGMFVVIGIVIFFTYSFGAWIGLAGAIMVWILVRSGIVFKYRILFTRKILTGGLILLIVLCSMFYVLWLLDVANYFDATGRSSFHSRIMIWESSVKMLKDNPILGIGLGTFQDYYLDYQRYFPPYLEWAVPQPHNIFLAFWLQTGIIGLIGFIWLLYIIIGSLLKSTIVHFRCNQDNHIYLLVLSFFVYVIIHGLADTLYWKNDLALIFWFFVGVGIVVKQVNTNNTE